VRSHFTEELRLVAKDRQIREAVTAVEERHHQLGEHASRVVTTRPHVPALYRVRRRLRETQSVGQFSDEERARMANDTLAVRGHHDALRGSGSVHHESALLSGMLMPRQHQFPLPGGRFRGYAP
jgi:hypothetical protein